MNILKKNLAPITEKAWDEIKTRTGEILAANLTARKFVDIDGPNGLEFGGISTGRLITPDHHDNTEVNYGIREFVPIVELRKPFELDLWELDNIERGAKDIDLAPLEKAVEEVALFEENAIYNGFPPSGIKGLQEASENETVSFPNNPNLFLKEVAKQIVNLKKQAVAGPYSLVLNAGQWLDMVKLSEGYPIQKQLKQILGGQVIISHFNQNSYLVSQQGGDFELAIGQDHTLGYDAHDTKKVKLYITVSFTFRVLSPEAIVVFENNENPGDG